MAVNTNTDHIIDGFIDIRKKKKLSQAAVAKRADLHQAAVGRIENKSTNPQLDTMIKLLNTMGYTLAIVPAGEKESHVITMDLFSDIESLNDSNRKRVKAYVDELAEKELEERRKATDELLAMFRPADIGDDYKAILEEELRRKYESID